METNEKTGLLMTTERIAEQMRVAIEEAINEGATIEKRVSCTKTLTCRVVDGLLLQKSNPDNTISVILDFRSDNIVAKVFEPSKADLEKMAAQKRAELEELEKQIKTL